MLEQRIENLENQVTKLTIAIEHLTKVLVGDTPPPVLASVKSIKATTQEAKQTPVKEKQPKPNDKEVAKAPTKEDVQKVLVELAKTKGKEAAKGILADFNAAKMSDVKPTDYQQVIDLATKASVEEAA